MHNNYYLLRQLTVALDSRLRGGVVRECFSQNKDELIIGFETPQGNFFIKATVGPDFSCLSFPDKFERARKNSVDIFAGLPGMRYKAVYQYRNERSFRLDFQDGSQVLFKLHGNRANVLLIRNGSITSIFRTQLQADMTLPTDQLDRTIDWSYEYFTYHQSRVRQAYFTFGKIVWRYLEEKGFATLSNDERWRLIVGVKKHLEGGVYYISFLDDLPTFTLVPIGKITATFHDPIEALNAFYNGYVRLRAFALEKKQLLAQLEQQLVRVDAWIDTNEHRLEQVSTNNRYRMWADVIMANMDKIAPGVITVSLPDFIAGNDPVEIKLKPDLSPQRNAEIYYKKARNQSIEASHLTRLIQEKRQQREAILSTITSVKKAGDLHSLRKESVTQLAPSKADNVALPYKEHLMMGFRIWVGRNAQANDRMLQQFTSKDDLWLHARDVPGSHVIIKYQAGKNFPEPVIERAAQLAAFNSKRRNESLCPVVVTPRKYVRKRKGDQAGVVVVDREKVIMAVPAE